MLTSPVGRLHIRHRDKKDCGSCEQFAFSLIWLTTHCLYGNFFRGLVRTFDNALILIMRDNLLNWISSFTITHFDSLWLVSWNMIICACIHVYVFLVLYDHMFPFICSKFLAILRGCNLFACMQTSASTVLLLLDYKFLFISSVYSADVNLRQKVQSRICCH